MNNSIIVWQKWSDPFGEDDNILEDDSTDDNDNNDNKFLTEEHNHDTEQLPDKHKKILGIKAIATPMGIIPMTENTASGKIFNFWLGHTNFDITKKIASIIEKTQGVETLDIFTRYRFRISVGKAFKDSDVMRDINKKIYQETEND